MNWPEDFVDEIIVSNKREEFFGPEGIDNERRIIIRPVTLSFIVNHQLNPIIPVVGLVDYLINFEKELMRKQLSSIHAYPPITEEGCEAIVISLPLAEGKFSFVEVKAKTLQDLDPKKISDNKLIMVSRIDWAMHTTYKFESDNVLTKFRRRLGFATVPKYFQHIKDNHRKDLLPE